MRIGSKAFGSALVRKWMVDRACHAGKGPIGGEVEFFA